MKKLVILIISVFCLGCSSGNMEYVKKNAEEKWSEQGYSIIGYEGYEWGFWGVNSYGGAYVWYTLYSNNKNGVRYSGALQRWGNEIHIYNLTAVDAIRP